MTPEHIKELVDVGLVSRYQLSIGEEELPSREDEVVIFRDYFIAGIVIPSHQFVLVVLDRYHIQLLELTSTAFVHLSKFIWAMVSYGGDPDIEVFTQHFALHNQTCRIKVDGVVHGCNYATYGFEPRRNENKNIMHNNKNKWIPNWVRYWFYAKVLGTNVTIDGEAKTLYPSASRR